MREPIKVLIADDESIVRKGLKATINWSEFDMSVVADAANGRRAWESFLEHRPQVVITDIVMPEMNGIELTRRIKEAAPDTKILLLSCHRDFEYAQQGIQLGVSGYLLKTAFEDDEIHRLLRGFREELGAPARKTDEGGAGRWESRFCAWLYGAAPELEAGPHAQPFWLTDDTEYHVYLVQRTDGVASIVEGMPSGLQAVCVTCHDDRCYMWFPSAGKKEIDAYLMEQAGCDSALHWYKGGAQSGLPSWETAVKELHAKAERDKHYGIHSECWPDALQQAIHIVAQDLKHPWSVSEVAARVGLSRSHFSTLFKRVTGENFIEFLYRIRLRVARDMLANTSLTQQDIAEHIGLIDGKYFSKWFKRSSNETPSEYRQRQKREREQTK
ncbi:response regulator [Paenibacillus sp. J5C_2022]|uniref:response regulator n=1 Tax=Paenibacillus sp. J5C2022 TaxID=2977129 RepID=UPI0021CE3CC9|nr:response regulator [Paenibacillus sp. J5C2022]MCU6708406.1 response regulator [Paenibacillus sp. J5C2022]